MQVAAAAAVVSEIHKVGGMVERAMGRVDEVGNMVFKVGGKIEDVLLATKVCTPSLSPTPHHHTQTRRHHHRRHINNTSFDVLLFVWAHAVSIESLACMFSFVFDLFICFRFYRLSCDSQTSTSP